MFPPEGVFIRELNVLSFVVFVSMVFCLLGGCELEDWGCEEEVALPGPAGPVH